MRETAGRFQILDRLGTGTLGELYRARELERGRTVALRIVNASMCDEPGKREAVVRAAERAAMVSHPALASTYECGQDGDTLYIAGEFVPGPRLSEVIQGTPLNARRALDLAVQVADGLAAAHAAGLAHGALSSRCVVLTPKGAAKVLDVGMLEWTAVAAGERVDDSEGLGAVLFEMLVGRPVRRGWPGEVRLPQIPEPVRPVLHRLLGLESREKYESMAVASASLRDALLRLTATGDGGAESVAQHVPSTAAAPGRQGTIVGLIVGLVVLAVVTAWWFYR